jgi:glycosyltransferase involved in cell wall biosynthesis
VKPHNERGAAGEELRSQSLVIPAFNEASRIDSTIESVLGYLKQQPYPAEVLIVNDGSSDPTSTLAHSWSARSDRVRVIDIRHAGKARAVRAGVEQATGDLVAFADADLATPICFLEQFRAAVDEGFDVIIGSREGEGAARIGEPGFRHVMGRVFNGLVRILLLPGIQDTQCGFKLFTREAARDLFGSSRLYSGQEHPSSGARVTAFDVELLVIARRRHYQVKVVPVTWTFGENSKVNPVRDTFNNLRDVLTVKWNDLRGRYD